MSNITIEDLSKAGLQYGFSRTRRHPSMKSFVSGNTNGVDHIDLEKTQKQLTEALSFLKAVQGAGKQILFVSTKPEVRQMIKEVALSLNMPFVAERFIGGTITNFPQMKKRVEKLHDLLGKKEKGELSVYTKKEQLLIQRDIDRLDRDFGGVSAMPNLPAAIVIIDPRHESIGIKEAIHAHIPVVALLNTDCSMSGIEYPIVGNDGSVQSVKFILNAIKGVLKA